MKCLSVSLCALRDYMCGIRGTWQSNAKASDEFTLFGLSVPVQRDVNVLPLVHDVDADGCQLLPQRHEGFFLERIHRVACGGLVVRIRMQPRASDSVRQW